MATTFLRAVSTNVGAGGSIIGAYKVPAGKAGAIKGLSLAARSSTKATVTVELCDTNGNVLAKYIEAASIPPGDTFIVIGAEQTQFIVAGDQVKVTASAGAVDAIMSLAEIG